MRTLRRILAFLGVLIVLATAALWALVATEGGLQWLVARAREALPDTLQVERASGRLIGPLRVEALRLDLPGLALEIDAADLDWTPSALLEGTLHVAHLTGQGIRAGMQPAEAAPPAEPAALADISLPVAVRIDALEVLDLAIQPLEGDAIIVHRIAAALGASGSEVQLHYLEVEAPQGTARLDGRVLTRDAYPLEATLSWQVAVPEAGQWQGDGRVSGDLKALELQHQLSGSATADLRAEAFDLLGAPTWKATLDVDVPALAAAHPAAGQGTLRARISAAGDLGSYSATATADATHELLEAPATLALEADGDLERVDLRRLELNNAEARLTAVASLLISTLELRAQAQWSAVRWPLTGPTQLLSPEGDVEFEGRAEDYRLAARAVLASDDFGTVEARSEAAGTRSGVAVEALTLRSSDQRLALDARGDLDFASRRFNATGRWQSLVWPLVGPPQIESPSGEFEASGLLDEYSFRLESEVQGAQIPHTGLQLRGGGDLSSVHIPELRARLLDGEVEVSLRAGWAPAPRWEAQVQARGLVPERQWPDVPGRIDARLESAGELGATGLRASVSLLELAGELHGQALDGQALVQLDGSAARIDTLVLQLGEARISASGSVAEQADLDWQVSVPAIDKVAPGSRGSLQASGRVAGPRATPRVDLDAEFLDVAAGAAGIESLRARGHIDLAPGARTELRIDGTGLDLAGQAWSALALRLEGTPEDHRLGIDAEGDWPLDTRAAGGWNGQRWQGALDALSFSGPDVGRWQLAAPVAVTASAQAASVQRLCLASAPAEACATLAWGVSEGTRVDIELQRFELQRLNPYLPPDLELDSIASARGQLRLPPGKSPRGELTLETTAGVLRLVGDGEPVDIRLHPGRISADSDGRTAQIRASLGLAEDGSLEADIAVADLDATPTLNGRVRGRYREQGLLTRLAPALREVRGEVEADLSVSGALAAPRVEGQLVLADAALQIPAQGLEISDIGLRLASTPSGPLRLTAGMASGSGRLSIDGDVDPVAQRLALQIRGTDFQLANTEELTARASPDLRIRAEGGQIQVRGEVVVPMLALRPIGLGGAVGPSGDVVIVDGEQPESAPLAIDADVRVTLGDEVEIALPGFEAQLLGQLDLRQRPGRAPSAAGTVRVARGEYEIYGQTLNIERGQVIFTGGPLDNPGLDLRAEREVDDVTVGARILGRVRSPQLELFSTPAMTDTSILSYLLFGRPPDARSGSESDMLAQGALALGMKGGNALAGALQGATGLDTLEFDSEGGIDQTSLVIGKYLSPELYVSYGVGLFEPINTFLVRYQISRRLSLETQSSGEHTGADLLYIIER